MAKANFRYPARASKAIHRLNLAEIDGLITLLERSYGPLKIKASQYVKIDDAEDAAVFARLQSIIEGKDIEAILKLMDEHSLLPEDLIGALMHKDRARAVEEFRSMLSQNLPEREWQGWFEVNDWVLGSSHVVVLDERDVDVGNQIDYMVKSEDGYLDVIEIKKPNLPFWARSTNHDNLIPHTELVWAITQANNYLFQLEKKMNSIEDVERFGCPILRPRALLIHGRSEEWGKDEREAQRLLNSSLAGIQVLTYDQVLARSERALTIRQPAESAEEPSPWD